MPKNNYPACYKNGALRAAMNDGLEGLGVKGVESLLTDPEKAIACIFTEANPDPIILGAFFMRLCQYDKTSRNVVSICHVCLTIGHKQHFSGPHGHQLITCKKFFRPIQKDRDLNTPCNFLSFKFPIAGYFQFWRAQNSDRKLKSIFSNGNARPPIMFSQHCSRISVNPQLENYPEVKSLRSEILLQKRVIQSLVYELEFLDKHSRVPTEYQQQHTKFKARTTDLVNF
jgi:hypothetical protein